MIARLTGVVVETKPSTIILEVNNVGYLIFTPHPDSFARDKTITLYTHLAVRENALDLYGFDNPEMLELFEHLLGLQKIGPKSALQILTQADVGIISSAVAKNDPEYLSKISGIGKKTAEKIVSGLKDVVPDTQIEADEEVVDALRAMGYSPNEIQNALRTMPEQAVTKSERLKGALKILNEN